MPPMMMPPVILWLASAAGALAAANWIARESRRINAILHPERFGDAEPAEAGSHTGRLQAGADGVYRPERRHKA